MVRSTSSSSPPVAPQRSLETNGCLFVCYTDSNQEPCLTFGGLNHETLDAVALYVRLYSELVLLHFTAGEMFGI